MALFMHYTNNNNLSTMSPYVNNSKTYQPQWDPLKPFHQLPPTHPPIHPVGKTLISSLFNYCISTFKNPPTPFPQNKTPLSLSQPVLPGGEGKRRPQKPWPPKPSRRKRHRTSGDTCRRRSTMYHKGLPIQNHTLRRLMGSSSRRVSYRWIRKSKARYT